MKWLKRLLGFNNGQASSESSSIEKIIEKYAEEDKKIKDAGSIDGRHYTEYVEEIKLLKREKRHGEAIELLHKLISAVEKEARVADWGVAPWYYEQLAIIFRKEKRYSDEVGILERYQNQSRAPGAKPAKLDERLKKAIAFRNQNK